MLLLLFIMIDDDADDGLVPPFSFDVPKILPCNRPDPAAAAGIADADAAPTSARCSSLPFVPAGMGDR